MTVYGVEMMTHYWYNEYMMGAMSYHLDKEYIEANSPEEAIKIAKFNFPNMVINEGYVKPSDHFATVTYDHRDTEHKIRSLKDKIQCLERQIETEKKRLAMLEKGD